MVRYLPGGGGHGGAMRPLFLASCSPAYAGKVIRQAFRLASHNCTTSRTGVESPLLPLPHFKSKMRRLP
jgi:hypothetical protein